MGSFLIFLFSLFIIWVHIWAGSFFWQGIGLLFSSPSFSIGKRG